MKGFILPKFISFGLSVLMMAITISLVPTSSHANTFHVTKAGNDSNTGSEISPFKTIKKGVGFLSPGDTLYVHSGTYSESILSWKTPIPNGKNWNQPITIATYREDTVTITPPSGHAFFWIQDGQAKYLIIDGFIIDGQKKAKHGLKFSNNSQYIRVQNSEIKNSAESGVIVSICGGCQSPETAPHNTFHEFLNLNVHHNGSSIKDHGFYIETSHNLVENGNFHHNLGNGGKFFHGNLSGVANYNIARNNVFYDNSTSGKWSCGLILSSGDGNMAYNNISYGNYAGLCILHRVTNARLFNNISYENDHYGIYVGKPSTNNSYVENNSVYNNSGFGIFVGDKAKNSNVVNNIAYLNKRDNIGLKNQTGTTSSHNMTTDPLFMNANAKDFRLKAQSPAIDKGMFINSISDDFTGNSRPHGSNYDIGAYEEISEGDSSPPTSPQSVFVQ